MVLQLQVWAFMLLQGEGAAIQLRPSPHVGADGLAGPPRRYRSLHYVGVVHRRHDRSRDRFQRRPQSVPRSLRPAVAGALRDGKLDEAIKIADRFGKSHLAKVVVAGLQEFSAHQLSAEISG